MAAIAVEGDAASFAALADAPESRGLVRVTVRDEASAADALRRALRGDALLVHAVAGRAILDRLYQDLGRLGTVQVRTPDSEARPDGIARLGADELEILRLLAQGHTIVSAAAALHLPLRTANRRVATARAVLGITTTTQAVALLVTTEGTSR